MQIPGFRVLCASCATACLILFSPGALADKRDLSFDERVDAQRRIERVYHEYRDGEPRSLEDAMPEARLEEQVRTYLRQSAALEKIWSTPVTADALDRELERIAGSTVFPDRLRRLFAALDHDPTLVRECLVRPVLVDRLSRNFFAFDGRIHAAALRELDSIRASVVAGVPLTPEQRGREHVETLVRAPEEGRTASRPGDRALETDRFDRLRESLPPSRIANAIEEDRHRFSFRVRRDDGDFDRIELATYAVPKTTWEDWWSDVAPTLDVNPAGLAGTDSPLPVLRGADACDAPDTWTTGGALGSTPEQRESHAAVWTGSLMLVYGGRVEGYYPPGLRYDPLTDTWSAMSMEGAPDALFPNLVWTGTEMIVWNGPDLSGRYDPLTDTWEPISDVGAPSAGGKLIWTGSELLVFGGPSVAGRYDPVADQWSPMSVVNAPATAGATAVWTGTEMILWGGYVTQPWEPVNTGGRYDPATDTWEATTVDGAPDPRTGHTAVWTGTRMIVWGGEKIGCCVYRSGASYDPVSDTWTPIAMATAPSSRVGHGAVWTGEAMLIWGGKKSDAGRYDPVTNTWTPLSLAGAPATRNLNSTVWTGERMIVWGGDSGFSSGETNTGGRYDPSSDVWTPTSTGPPAPREEHAAAWTGTEMIVWGGDVIYGESSASGGRYDPTLDAWSPVSRVGAPSGQSMVWIGNAMFVAGGYLYDPSNDTWTQLPGVYNVYESVVWTGSEVIVWGGIEGGSELRRGGRYNPSNGVYTALPTAGSGEARWHHTAVWTGSEMIIWGGVFENFDRRSGRRYDPAANQWSSVTEEGVPSARSRHGAVWTGSEMLIWGGNDLPPSGGRYDPVTDTWTPLSTIDPPPESEDQVVVWTGARMLVFGGGNTDDPLGGSYDPAADTWTPLETAGAPERRSKPAGVWTGTHLIVWGGDGAYGKRNDGGIYSVDSDEDGLADGCDNCRLVPNADQDDADGDGAGEACDACPGDPGNDPDTDGACAAVDNCALVANPDQSDADGDLQGDDCDPCAFDAEDDVDGDGLCADVDNCPSDENLEQADFDGDGTGDVCDLDDGRLTLRATSPTEFVWDAESAHETWNAYSGDLAVLRGGGAYTQAPGENPLATRVCGLPEPTLDVAVLPASNEAVFILASGVAGGMEGDLGSDSMGNLRANTDPCP